MDTVKKLNNGIIGTHCAIIDGEIVQNIPSILVYVTSQSELSNFSDYWPGTFAATYGLGTIWQLKPDGTWQEV